MNSEGNLKLCFPVITVWFTLDLVWTGHSRIFCAVLYCIWEWRAICECHGFDVLAIVTVESKILWVAVSGSLLKVRRRFGGNYQPSMQVRSKQSAVFYRGDRNDRFLWNVCRPQFFTWPDEGIRSRHYPEVSSVLFDVFCDVSDGHFPNWELPLIRFQSHYVYQTARHLFLRATIITSRNSYLTCTRATYEWLFIPHSSAMKFLQPKRY
jgi:hypothetical protein